MNTKFNERQEIGQNYKNSHIGAEIDIAIFIILTDFMAFNKFYVSKIYLGFNLSKSEKSIFHYE